MLRAQLLIGRAHIGIALNLETGRIGVQRRAPLLPRSIDFAEERKRRGLVDGCPGSLIGRIGCRRLPFLKLGSLVPVIPRIDGERRAGIAKPVRGIDGLGRDGGGEQVQGLSWIGPRQSRVCLAPQLLGRLACDQARPLGVQGLLQPNGLTCQICLAEAFLGLSGGCRGRQACGNQGGSQQRPDHGMFLALNCRRMLRP